MLAGISVIIATMDRFKALIKGSVVVTVGTLVGGFLSYMYSALMGRMLGPADFGDLGAINSYFVLLTAVGGGLLTVTMYYVSTLSANNNLVGVARFYKKFVRIVLIGSIGLAALAIFTSPLAASFFSIGDKKALAFALLSIVASLILVVNRGVLQGTQRFGQLTISNILEYAIKLAAAYLLVKLGFSIAGAALAIPIGALGAFALTLIPLRNILRGDGSPSAPSSDFFPNRKEITLYFLPALASNAFLLLLMNLDILLVKKFFAAELAGQYVAVSTIAKIIFYITGPITAVMFPLIATQRSRGEKHYSTLIGATLITLVGSAIILFLYTAFDSQIVTALYGKSYQALSSLLPTSAGLVIVLSLVNLMSQYFLSIQRYWFIAEMAVAAIGLIIYVLSHTPNSVSLTLHYLITGFLVLLSVMVVDYLYMKRSQLATIWSKNA